MKQQSAFPEDMRYSARERAMQTSSQTFGSFSNCVATKQQRAARRYKVRTLPNSMSKYTSNLHHNFKPRAMFERFALWFQCGKFSGSGKVGLCCSQRRGRW